MSSSIRYAVALACLSITAVATARHDDRPDRSRAMQFERVSTFVICENTSCDRDLVEITAAEIVAASEDGKTLVYTDSPNNSLGFVDIRNPSKPRGLGALKLDGEPTSVAVQGRWALVGVNTSESLANPSGYLGVFDIASCASAVLSCQAIAKLPLAGQPDSVAVSPDGRYAAIAIENERDEDVTVNGVEGGLPQAPGGWLQIVNLHGSPAQWSLRSVDLSGLAAYAPEDPEPEYVSINALNIAVVTLQENNHIALVHLPSGKVIRHFPAGEVDLKNVDADNEGLLNPIYSLDDLAREPDAVAWLTPSLFATANEGDLFGGSRGLSIFGAATGKVWFDSDVELEQIAAAYGHYPDDRGDNKGVEPEGIAFARYGRDEYLFVGMERANLTAVFETSGFGRPRFVQALPSGIGPEGLLPIPKRDLFVIAAEEDEDLRSTISIFRRQKGAASYPNVVSGLRKSSPLAGKAPIGWVALSALAADRRNPQRLYTVHDSYLLQSRIYAMDVSKTPARITDEIVLNRDGTTVDYDIEGLAQRAGGGFWVASEGSGTGAGGTPNLLVEVTSKGEVVREIALPAEVVLLKRSNGYEGVAVTGSGNDEQVYLAFQREWTSDPAGFVRIGRYTPASDDWRFFYYPLDAVESPAGGWVGLSEVVALDTDRLLILERDNQSGPDARIKRLYTVRLDGVEPAPPGVPIPQLTKRLVRDLVPDLARPNGWLQEKVEGVTVAADGSVYIVTDNDGVDGNTGETQFIRLGERRKLGF
jgi:hypothetical protein